MGGALADIFQPSPQADQPVSVPAWKLGRAILFWIFMFFSIVLECCFVLAPLCVLLSLFWLAGFRLLAEDPGKARVALQVNRVYQWVIGRLVAWWWLIPLCYTEFATRTPSRFVQQQQATHPVVAFESSAEKPRAVDADRVAEEDRKLSPEQLLAKQDAQPTLTDMPSGDRVLMICNHRTSLDWWWLWSYLWRQGRMHDERIVLKSPLRGAPGLGWGLQAQGPFFLSRRWADDQEYLQRALGYFGICQTPLQMLLFPEGTDFTESTKARSHQFAEKMGLDKYEFVMHPRVTGFTAILEQLRREKTIDAVYDCTIAFPGFFPQNPVLLMKGLMPEALDFHVMRYDIHQLPHTTEGLETWVQERFREKEERLRRYYSSGKAMNDKNNESGAALRHFSVDFPPQPTIFWTQDRLRLLLGIVTHLITLFAITFCVVSYPVARWFTLFGLCFFLGMNKFFGGWDQGILYRLK